MEEGRRDEVKGQVKTYILMLNIFSMVYKSDNLKPVNSFMGGAPGEGCLYIVYNTLTWVYKWNMSAPRLSARARKKHKMSL